MKISPLLFALILGAFCNATAADKASGHKRVGVEEFQKILKTQKLTVLDVRTPDEYKTGHIKGAININFYDKDFKKKVSKLDKSKAYLMHCHSGGRSGKASKMMVEAGFRLIYDLAPGMSGWLKARKPVATGGK